MPKPLCSVSNRTKSQPADFRMCPMPGVANSTTKCPTLSFLLPASLLSVADAMIADLPRLFSEVCRLARPLSVSARIDKRSETDLLAGNAGGAVAVEVGEVRCTYVRGEGHFVVVN